MATVIKAGQSGTILRHLSPVDLADHLKEARAVIEAARREGAEIVAEARRLEAGIARQAQERGFAEGRAKGYEDGRAAGFNAARKEADETFCREQGSLVSALGALLRNIEERRGDLISGARRDVLGFAVDFARAVTFQVGALHEESCRENLKRCLEMVADRSRMTVVLSLKDAEAMKRYAPELLRDWRESAVVEFREEACTAPGGCLVRMDNLELDARLETQTEELARLLVGGPAHG